MQLAEMCKAVREQNKWSQRKLAAAIGSTQTEVSFIERGFIPLDVRKIEQINFLFKQITNQNK